MKTKELIVGIKSLEKGLEEFSTTLKALQRGERVKPKEERLNFVSLEAARKFLTPKRIELLRAVHRQEPRSIYELAKSLARDLRNVKDDVDLLAQVGLIELEHEHDARERIVPRVAYDNLEVRFQIAV